MLSLESKVQFPQSRVASPDVIRRLREIDETAELLYLGAGRWILGRVRWHADAIAQAESIMARALHAIHTAPPHLRPSRRLVGRVQFALLALQGFRPMAEYREHPKVAGFEGAVVEDFRRMLWKLRHTSDAELFRELEAAQDKDRLAARADLTDPARARDAWRYAFTLSHSVTRHDHPDHHVARSGYTIQRVIQ